MPKLTRTEIRLCDQLAMTSKLTRQHVRELYKDKYFDFTDMEKAKSIVAIISRHSKSQKYFRYTYARHTKEFRESLLSSKCKYKSRFEQRVYKYFEKNPDMRMDVYQVIKENNKYTEIEDVEELKEIIRRVRDAWIKQRKRSVNVLVDPLK